MAKLDDAIKIRDIALRLLEEVGQFEQTNIGPLQVWQGTDISMSYKTPFQKLPPVADSMKYQTALLKQGERFKHPHYLLDIWVKNRKVFSIQWDPIELISFHRGDWEKSLETISETHL